MRRMFALAALALAAAPQTAQAEPLIDGVWRGTIGTLPVQVCLSASRSYPVGSYYYLSKLTPISLLSDDGKSWKEGYEGKAVWKIALSGQTRITGTWAQGARSLPITLTRQPMGDDGELDGPCESTAYLAPRITAPRIVPVPASAGKLAYTRLDYKVGKSFTAVEIASFQLRAERPGDAAINRALRGLLDPAKGQVDYLGCMKGNLGNSGTDGDFSMVAEPSFASGEFVEATVSDGGSCGGAHPYNDRYRMVFDRVSGKRVELGRWLNAGAITVKYDRQADYTERKLTEAFKKLVLSRMTIDSEADCKDVLEQADYWDIGLVETGLTFEPSLPHAMQACGDVASVPFAQLTPWLSAEGKAGRARVAGKPHAL